MSFACPLNMLQEVPIGKPSCPPQIAFQKKKKIMNILRCSSIACLLLKVTLSNAFVYKWILTPSGSSITLRIGGVHIGDASLESDGLINVRMRVGTGQFSLKENEEEENLRRLPYATLNKPYELRAPVGTESHPSYPSLYLHNVDLMTCGWTIPHDAQHTRLITLEENVVGVASRRGSLISVYSPSYRPEAPGKSFPLTKMRQGALSSYLDIPGRFQEQEIIVWRHRYSAFYAREIEKHNSEAEKTFSLMEGEASNSHNTYDLGVGKALLEYHDNRRPGFRVDFEGKGPVGLFD
jgi:hypothetical protein